jgi:hypothetical protein
MDMREKIARRLAPTSWAVLDRDGPPETPDHHDCYRDWSLSQAGACLEAMREPTDEMLQKGTRGDINARLVGKWLWQDMIDAALAPRLTPPPPP